MKMALSAQNVIMWVQNVIKWGLYISVFGGLILLFMNLSIDYLSRQTEEEKQNMQMRRDEVKRLFEVK